MLGDGRLAVLHGRGDLRLGVLDPETRRAHRPRPAATTAGIRRWPPTAPPWPAIAYGAAVPKSLVRVDTVTGRAEALRRDVEELPDLAYLPRPGPVEIGAAAAGARVPLSAVEPGRRGLGGRSPVRGLRARRADRRTRGTALDLEKAYFTSAASACSTSTTAAPPATAGPTASGCSGQWGVVDVEDIDRGRRVAGGRRAGRPGRIAIRGGSAGGWTVMAACCRPDVFAGGRLLLRRQRARPAQRTTHDFESRYVEWLVGPDDPRLYASARAARRWSAACPARCCCCRGSTTPWCRPSSRRPSPTPWPNAASPAPTSPSRASHTASAAPRPAAAALAAELAFYQQIFC